MKGYSVYCFVALIALSVLSGCGPSKLSPEEAKGLLSKNPPGKVFRLVSKRLTITDSSGERDPQKEEERTLLERLHTAGYISLKQTSKKNGRRTEYSYEALPAPKLGPFVMSQDAGGISVKIAEIVPNNVTDISQRGDTAEVSYANKVVPNEVAPFFGPLNKPVSGLSHATFRYRDGKWQ